MSVLIETWHRILPLTPEAYDRFLDFYARRVVEASRDYLENVGGWKFEEGDTNCDICLYRYDSVAQVGETMASFGADADYLKEVNALFSDIEIEETRTLGMPIAIATDARLDAVLDETPEVARRYFRVERSLPTLARSEALELFEVLVEAHEKQGSRRLVTAFEPIVGDVTKLMEIWVLPESASDPSHTRANIDPGLLQRLAEIAPEVSGASMQPVCYSRLT